MKCNISIKEVQAMLDYMKKHNLDVATLAAEDKGFFDHKQISKEWDSEPTNVTDYDSL